MKKEEWDMWAELKVVVKARWGLTSAQRRANFYRMRPLKGEDAEKFVLRVEDERK